MSPRVTPKQPDRSSYQEYRSRGGTATTQDQVFWEYLTAPSGFVTRSELTGTPQLATMDDEEQRVLSKASNPAGGYLVPADFDDQVTSVRRSRAVIANLARELATDDGQTLAMPSATTHGVATWTAENASYTASDETFSQVSLGAFKASVKVIASEELTQDALGDFDRFLAEEIGVRIAVLEETAFAAGDGTGKPLGVIHSSSGFPVTTAATGSATSFKLGDVRSAYDALPAGYRADAAWVFSPSAFSSLAGLVDTAGGLVLPTLHALEPSLFGRPVYVSPDFPACAANARSAAFGDWRSAYTVRRVRGVGVQRILEMHSDSGQIGYRAFLRLDGRPVLTEAAVVLRNSAT